VFERFGTGERGNPQRTSDGFTEGVFMRSFTKLAGVAGMSAAVAAIGLGAGAGTATAQPRHPVAPHVVTAHPVQHYIDRIIDSFYFRGELSPLDHFSDMLTPKAG
jgi:hypothetical protein